MTTSTATTVELREITSAMVATICALSETLPPRQRSFVAPNEISLAQAEQSDTAWCRAIYAADEPVGFIMLNDDAEAERYFIWRLMIAQPFQGRGVRAPCRGTADRLCSNPTWR